MSSILQSAEGNCIDPLDALVDFSDYDKLSYQSPSRSPSMMKTEFAGGRAVPNAMPSTQPDLAGPSHNYGMYKQQTGIPQGAIASTLAINQGVSQYGFGSGYMSGLDSVDEFVDFGTAPRQGSFNASDIDMEFDSPNAESSFYYPEASSSSEFVNPGAIGAGLSVPNMLPAQSNNVARVWPGMHQQQAAKAQAQQKQQQQIIQQQRQQSASAPRPAQRARGSHPPTDPIVEEKISQLLNSMRQQSVGSDDLDHNSNSSLSHARMRKDEEEMDEDERLLASEEGKKLSSKERRQLRNKVSARAFRSRRKEYISQLEGEIAQKVNENQDLRSANRALLEENTRLSDLTRMLLSSPSFSGFLDTLAANPATAPQLQPTARPKVEQPQQAVRKDINPYQAQQQMQTQQHVGMTMIPEHHMDFSMLELGNEYAYQPQVFSVLSLPEPTIDTAVLAGKPLTVFSTLASEDAKIELPTVERAPVSTTETTDSIIAVEEAEIDDSDPLFALYQSSPAPTVAAQVSGKEFELDINILANISLKPAVYEMVVRTDDKVADAAMGRVNRLCALLDGVCERLEGMTTFL